MRRVAALARTAAGNGACRRTRGTAPPGAASGGCCHKRCPRARKSPCDPQHTTETSAVSMIPRSCMHASGEQPRPSPALPRAARLHAPGNCAHGRPWRVEGCDVRERAGPATVSWQRALSPGTACVAMSTGAVVRPLRPCPGNGGLPASAGLCSPLGPDAAASALAAKAGGLGAPLENTWPWRLASIGSGSGPAAEPDGLSPPAASTRASAPLGLRVERQGTRIGPLRKKSVGSLPALRSHLRGQHRHHRTRPSTAGQPTARCYTRPSLRPRRATPFCFMCPGDLLGDALVGSASPSRSPGSSHTSPGPAGRGAVDSQASGGGPESTAVTERPRGRPARRQSQRCAGVAGCP